MAVSDIMLAARLNDQAELLKEQGRYAEAEPLYRQALGDPREDARARAPLLSPPGLTDLAELYRPPGPLRRGRAALQAGARRSARRRSGPSTPISSPSLNNLAELLSHQGRYAEAEPLYKRALAICEKALGRRATPPSPSALNNLASLYQARAATPRPSRSTSAALAIREKALGPDHADVVKSRSNLDDLYSAQKGSTGSP